MYTICVLVIVVHMFSVFFFFKQKTAYEMRISDWSSDVCSSDLPLPSQGEGPKQELAAEAAPATATGSWKEKRRHEPAFSLVLEIGRASCRERVCQYV